MPYHPPRLLFKRLLWVARPGLTELIRTYKDEMASVNSIILAYVSTRPSSPIQTVIVLAGQERTCKSSRTLLPILTSNYPLVTATLTKFYFEIYLKIIYGLISWSDTFWPISIFLWILFEILTVTSLVDKSWIDHHVPCPIQNEYCRIV